MFYRYADDCFAVFPNHVSVLKFHHDLNANQKDVKFKYKLAFLERWFGKFYRMHRTISSQETNTNRNEYTTNGNVWLR